ncbi:MAG TPA: sucrase ferredoxin [Acidimicrobiales bacterium]|nr:sucrase ferredoxin [Acidimicrobiales bacterium]
MAERLGLRCAPESLRRDEPLIATASRVQRWMIVEQPGAWGVDALAESKLDPDTAAALADAARAHGVRVLLARRRANQRRLGAARTVFLAHSRAERWWLEQVDVDPADPKALLRLDLGALAFPEPPGIGAPGPASLHMVCTNGRHDPCCADFGRPVMRALAEAGAPDVWECSHVGGDRFAANVVCLPEGIYYGRVEPHRAERLVADYRERLLDLAHYRGRSCYGPLVQAAEAFGRAHLGERRIDGMSVLATGPRADRSVAVRLQQRDGATLEVVVARDRSEAPVQMTCHGGPGVPWRYRLVEIGSL